DAVTVAELTGEIPIIRDDDHHEAGHEAKRAVQVAEPAPPAGTEPVAEQKVADRVTEEQPRTAYWSEPEPRWPKSPPQPQRLAGPERSAYPRPMPHTEVPADPAGQSGAEDMSPDPVDHYADFPVDVMDSEVREAEPAAEDSAYVRSFLQSDSTLFGGQTLADEVARRRGAERAERSVDSLAEERLDED